MMRSTTPTPPTPTPHIHSGGGSPGGVGGGAGPHPHIPGKPWFNCIEKISANAKELLEVHLEAVGWDFGENTHCNVSEGVSLIEPGRN